MARAAPAWVPAIEAGRGAAYTLPTVMANFPNTKIATVPIIDVEPGTVLLAWHSEDADPLVATFVACVRSMLATTRADVHNRGL